MPIGPIRDGDGLDPVNGILENEQTAQFENDFMRQHRIRRGRADVEKKRAARFQNPANLRGPFAAPSQIGLSILPIGKFSVPDAKVVGRRGHDKVDMFCRQLRHAGNAIFQVKIELGHRNKVREPIRFVQRIRLLWE